ncbi:MAG: type II toxin-antitoxin system VapC family toxin [Thermoleophilia bacterium]|nr:type II toxin-antitoxin system VapC family toxin [Thermoleophilia bacterium]
MADDEAVVCDASVLAAMVFMEPGSAGAHSLTQSRRLYAPSLLWYELAHILVRKTALAPDNASELREAFAAGLRVAVRCLEPSWPGVVELAQTHDLTTYDAAYLQVALELRVRLATLDKHLAQAAEGLGIGAGPRV